MANPTSRQAAAETWHLWGRVNWQVSDGHYSTFSHRCLAASLWAFGRGLLVRVQLPSLLIVVAIHPAAR